MLIVDLSKITANIEILRKKTNKDIIAVVKSNAYGLGASHIIPFLKKCGVKYFFVNHFNRIFMYFNRIFRAPFSERL